MFRYFLFNYFLHSSTIEVKNIGAKYSQDLIPNSSYQLLHALK
jgi:hypothetical protein